MNRLGSALVGLAIVIGSTGMVAAGIPEELKGSWILDAEATQQYLKSSPKWTAEDEKYLPTILKRMAQVLYEFTDDTVTASMRGKSQSIQVQLAPSDPGKYVLEGIVRGKPVVLTVSFVDKNTINIRSSASNDMDYYVWKRGQLPDKAGPSDEQLAVEVMKKAMEETSHKSEAQGGEPQ